MKRLLFALALLIPFSLMPNAAASHDTASPAICYSADTVKHGTTGNDLDSHTSSSSNTWCYDFRAGNDTFSDSFGWADVILGAAGTDTLNLGSNGDTGDGGDGTDTIHGDGASDILYGGSGDDTVYGDNGGDTIFGGPVCTENAMYGFGSYPADNGVACSVNDGSDFLYGGAGDWDWLWDSNSDQHSDGVYDYINGGAGSNDICTGGPEDEFVGCETVNVIPNV